VLLVVLVLLVLRVVLVVLVLLLLLPVLLLLLLLTSLVPCSARAFLAASAHGVGAYSHSKGVSMVRDDVCDFIERRDGHSADPESIFLTNGASDGVKAGIGMLVRDEKDGIMIRTWWWWWWWWWWWRWCCWWCCWCWC